jgi:putative ABC transport system substrate-binding protein
MTRLFLQPDRLLKPLISVWVIAVAIMLCSTGALSADVLIVVDSDSGPYTQAADQSEQALRSRGHQTRRVMLKDLDLQSLGSRTQPVLSVGSKSAMRAASAMPDSTLLIYCMTSNPSKRGLTTRKNTSGVSTDPDLARQIELIELSGVKVRRIGMMYNSNKENSNALRASFARSLPSNWTLVAIDIESSGSAANSIDALFDGDVDLVWTAADTGVYNASMVKAMLLRSIRDRVPVFGFSHALVRAGAPLGAGFRPSTQGQRAAELLINGTIGVHEPADTQLAINETALSRIDLKLSSDLNRLAEVRFGTE